MRLIFIRYFLIFSYLLLFNALSGQIVINEVVSSNNSGLIDEDQEYVDWIELYNNSNQTVNLDGYVITDKNDFAKGWVFPAVEMPPKSFLIVYASGKDRRVVSLNYKTVIDVGDNWQYAIPPDNKIKDGWRLPGFNASDWLVGPSGFGYGDGDDNTIIQPLLSIYLRKEFTINNLSSLHKILLHVDYDDGFIAFINGDLVAMGNINLPDKDDFEVVNVPTDREARMYSGGYPERFEIDMTAVSLKEGVNVLTFQGYNVSSGSSDFSLIPFLTLGSTDYAVNSLSQWVNAEGEGGLHTNFSISKDGETLYLYNPAKALIDSVYVVPLPANVAYGRFPDGAASWYYFPTPTPGAPNVNRVSELRNDSIIFSHPSGFYNQTINLTMTASSNDVTIRYTTNGAEPNNASQRYNGSITIPKTTVIRAATFFQNELSGEIFSNTYFRNNGHNLPVVSISSDPKNFFDYNEGILVEGPNAQQADPKYGANYWMDWEKPIHLEYFDQSGQLQIDQKAGVKVFGGWSRMSAQKSMAIFARNTYGSNQFKYKFFHDRKHETHKTFLLRNSGNDWTYTMFRDGYVSEVVKTLDIDRLAFQPTVVYLNGEYWGILNMREKPNEHYLAANHGVDPNSVNRLEANSLLIQGTAERYSSLINFVQNRSIINDNDYIRTANDIDVSNFIDYQLTQIYINNRDWPGNNIKYWNTTKAYSKFRWILYDTDFGLGLYGNRDYTLNTIEFATAPNNSGWPNPAWSTLLLRRMLSNPQFKHQFINRMADLMNTVFKPEVMNSTLDSVAALIEPEITAHLTKWGGNYNTWNNRVNVIPTFNDNRPSAVYEHFIRYFGLDRTCTVHLTVSHPDEGQIKISTITPKSFPFAGTYFSNVPITFVALPKPGYRFVRWENATVVTDPVITLTLTGTTRLHAVFEPDNTFEYNVVINEINYRSDAEYNTGDWIELYNAGNHTIDLSGWVLSDNDISNGYVFKAGDVIYPNGYLVVSNNLTDFKTVHPKVDPLTGNFEFGLSNTGDIIALRDSNNKTIDIVVYGILDPWPEEPLTTSATLELISPFLDRNLHSSWQAGPPGGTPGERNASRTSTETIELMPNVHQASCFPTQFSDYTTLRFYSPGNSDYSIIIYDMQGRVQNSLQGKLFEQGTHYLDIFTESEKYQKGMHLVKLQTNLGTETIKVIKF